MVLGYLPRIPALSRVSFELISVIVRKYVVLLWMWVYIEVGDGKAQIITSLHVSVWVPL